MGTASSGSRGSGSGRRAGNQGGIGEYMSSGGKMGNKPYDEKQLSEEITTLFKELFSRASPYMQQMFNNPYLNKAYAEMFTLSSLLKKENAAESIAKRYNLDLDETAFLLSLLSRLHETFRNSETDARCEEAVRNTLEKFLFESVNNDPYLIFESTGREVVAAMQDNAVFWKSISGYFLWHLSTTVYKKDIEAKIPEAAIAATREIERRTNHLLDSFKQRSGDQKPDYRNLFSYISRNWEWFKNEMTHEHPTIAL